MGYISVLVSSGCFNTSGSPLVLWLYSSEQYSVHVLSISLSSLSYFPCVSCMVVIVPWFELVRSFTSWAECILVFPELLPMCILYGSDSPLV